MLHNTFFAIDKSRLNYKTSTFDIGTPISLCKGNPTTVCRMMSLVLQRFGLYQFNQETWDNFGQTHRQQHIANTAWTIIAMDLWCSRNLKFNWVDWKCGTGKSDTREAAYSRKCNDSHDDSI